jgi:hypothetical protein
MWIGHVTRIKHRNTRLEYREKAKRKIGREKRARLKNNVEELPKNLSLLTTPRSILSGKKQIATTNIGCNTYYYEERNGMLM